MVRGFEEEAKDGLKLFNERMKWIEEFKVKLLKISGCG
jgi:hypothetical protein